MIKNKVGCIGALVSMVMLLLPSATGLYYTVDKTPVSANEYKGCLKIYLVEIKSSWRMTNGEPFHYAFIDYIYNGNITIGYLDTYRETFTWSSHVNKRNTLVIAAVFNAESHTAYAVPPARNPFEAHYLDAAAAAKPGETGFNVRNNEFTHTVLCEIGSLSTCPHCAELAEVMEEVFENGSYPFYYIEFVVDKNPKAAERMREYNLYYVPDAFYDGGRKVVLGSGHSSQYHRYVIITCG